VPAEPRERCHRHQNVDAVADCAQCGLPLCLECAVPVRGQVLGAECLGIDLVQPPKTKVGFRYLPWAGIGFALAALSTVLPWRKYGLGSGPFGAWGANLRWSVLAAISAVAGLIIWSLPMITKKLRRPSPWVAALRLLAALTLVASGMHLLRPPIVGPPSYGAWVAIAGSVVALAGTWGPLPPSD
jgi:hypothetical protein